MSPATYTVSLPAETADRLTALASAQGCAPEEAIAAAIADYIEAWEGHAADLADDERVELPWLKKP